MVSMRPIAVADRDWISGGSGLGSGEINSLMRPSAVEGWNLPKAPTSMTSAAAIVFRSYHVVEVNSVEADRCCSLVSVGRSEDLRHFGWGSLAAVLIASAMVVVPGYGLQPKAEAGGVGVGVGVRQSHHAAGKKSAAAAAGDKDKRETAEKNAYDFTLPGADGKDVPIASFKGKYLLIVNLGRKSAYGEQLAALVKLNDAYKEKGLVVIGVPSNQFGLAEPGTPAEIQKAYADAKVDFPVMAVSKVAGDDELPLYGYLTRSKSAPPGGPVHWNYTKFIIDKNGNVVARLDPDVTPDSSEMKATIDQVLDGSYKSKKAQGKAGAKAGEDDDGED